MKSFLDILALFKSSGAMDFCEDLSNVQSIFNYANEYIKPLHKIQHRGGNEPYINDITAKLVNLFRSKGYVDTRSLKPLERHENELRRITFFLIVNTEATFKYDLMGDHTVSHLLNAIPQISQCLLLGCIWGSHLDKFFYECISYTPIWFAYQFVENTADSLKYADPYETLDRVENMVKSIYLNIARSDYRQMETVDKKIILAKYYNVTMDLMRHFFSPDAEKFEKWTKKKFYKYSGFVLKHNLEMMLFCFKTYQQKPPMVVPDEKYGIYTLMREREPLVDNHSEAYSDTVDETLLKLNTTLLNSLQNNVMQVNCHAFLYWVEIDLDDDTTLQRVVGEAAYHVQELINQNECFQHDVNTQLKTISIKPLTLEQRIAESTIGEIINKLEKLDGNEPEVVLWLQAFVNYGELVFGNEECLESLEAHANHLTPDHVKTIIQYASNINFDEDGMVEERLLEIIFKSLDHFDEFQILEVAQYSIENRKSSETYLKTGQFEQFLIEVFNKYTFDQEKKAFLKLLVQDPKQFYGKVFEEALTSPVQMSQMLNIIRTTSDISKLYVEENMRNAIEEKSQMKEHNVQQLLPEFIAKLFSLKILPCKEFIIDHLYKSYLMKAMKDKCIHKVLLIIKIFLQIAQTYKFDDICAPILVMGAQILEYYRWNLVNFTEEHVELITKAIEFITEVSKKFLPVASEQDKKWIISRIASYKPLTRYYYQKYSLTRDEQPLIFDSYLHPSGFKQSTKQEAVKFLCEHLIRCTSKEISWLAKNEDLIGHFWDTMELTCKVVERSKDLNSLCCFRYCSNGFFTAIEKIVLPQCETADAKIDLLQKILKFVSCLRELSIYNELFMNIHGVMFTIIKTVLEDKKNTIESDIRPLITSLADCETKTIVLRNLQEILG